MKIIDSKLRNTSYSRHDNSQAEPVIDVNRITVVIVIFFEVVFQLIFLNYTRHIASDVFGDSERKV